jgi:phosphoribosyl-AMP cyclohydrolase
MKIQKLNKLITAKMADAVFTKDGLIPVVVQDVSTHEVLMVAYMNQTTLAQTIKTGTMTYWSRSRKCVWIKGQTSGQFQRVRSIRLDCDGDTLLFKVKQEGSGACHTGARTCFYRKLEA